VLPLLHVLFWNLAVTGRRQQQQQKIENLVTQETTIWKKLKSFSFV
jgi:hypothetical protein